MFLYTLPKISVITPSFNQVQFIEETILSVQNQNYPNLEHIIVDGGSTDGTLDILEKYSGRIKWISERDTGQANAINKGLRMAQGEIIGWLNSDDIYMVNAICRVVEVFGHRPEIDLIYGDFAYMDPSGYIFEQAKLIDFRFDILLHDSCYIGQPAVFFRKRVIDKIGYIDETLQYAMDWEYWLRAASSGCLFLHLPVTMAGFRFHINSKTTKRSVDLFDEVRLAKSKYWTPSMKGILGVNYCYDYVFRKFYRWKKRAIQLWHLGIIEFPCSDTSRLAYKNRIISLF